MPPDEDENLVRGRCEAAWNGCGAGTRRDAPGREFDRCVLFSGWPGPAGDAGVVMGVHAQCRAFAGLCARNE